MALTAHGLLAQSGKRARRASGAEGRQRSPKKPRNSPALHAGGEGKEDAPTIQPDAAARVAGMSIQHFLDGGFLELVDMKGRVPQLDLLGHAPGASAAPLCPRPALPIEAGARNGRKQKQRRPNGGAEGETSQQDRPLAAKGRQRAEGARPDPEGTCHKQGQHVKGSQQVQALAGKVAGVRVGSEGHGTVASVAAVPLPSKHRSEAAAHAADLDALKQRDPDFFAYLQDADEELLAFGEQGDSDGEEDVIMNSGQLACSVDGDVSQQESDQADTDVEEAGVDEQFDQDAAAALASKLAMPPSDGAAHGIITESLVGSWCVEAVENASLRSTRNLLKAYRLACHLGEEEDAVEGLLRQVSQGAFNRVLLFVLKEADGIFQRMLGIKEGQRDMALVSSTPRWHKVAPLLKSYLGNTLHLLGSIREKRMLVYVLRRLRSSVRLMVCSERIQRKTLKATLDLFSNGASGGVRLQAYLLTRAIAQCLPSRALPTALKGVYRAYVNNSRLMTMEGAVTLGLMARCCVDLYGLYAEAGYEHAFTYVRQLAVLLRGAVTAKTKDAFREVYCWQTMNSLDLWVKVVAAYPDRPEMRDLGHPLAQILAGVIRLVGSPRYIPLRLRCARMLATLGHALHARTHLAPLMMEMLQWKGLSQARGGGQGALPESPFLLRASKASLQTASFQQDFVEQVMEILAEHLAQAARSVAFPEMSLCTLLALKTFAKQTPVERFRAAARGLLAAVEANCGWLASARSQLTFPPSSTGKAGQWDPAQPDKAPLESYAEALCSAASQKRSMASASQMEVGLKDSTRAPPSDEGGSDEDPADDESDDEDGEEGDSEATSTEDEGGRRPAGPKQHAQRPCQAGGLLGPSDGRAEEDGLDDLVEDYQFSDDESP